MQAADATDPRRPRPLSGRTLLLTEFKERYLKSILTGNESNALRLIDEALRVGVTPRNIYLHVLMPAQADLGELWMAGRITIAEEHRATQVTLHAMAGLKQRTKPKPPIGKRAVLTSLTNDPHVVGGRVVSDFLYMDGWEVDYLGANTPKKELISFVQQVKADLVGISVTLAEVMPEAAAAIRELKALKTPPKVLIGGTVIVTHPEQVKTLGADGIAKDAGEAIDLARLLVGLPPVSASLEQYLRALGLRIAEQRKLQRLSQQQLAESSGLDRAYISAVEHGKHNLTIGAVMRLADALGLTLEELVIGETH